MYEIEYSCRTDLDEILSDEQSYRRLGEVFGFHDAEWAAYEAISGEEFECEEDVVMAYHANYNEILCELSNESPLTSDDLDTLGISFETAKEIGCAIEDNVLVIDGVEVEAKFRHEDKRQMVLFPKMEAGLPPFRYLVPVDPFYFV